MKGALGKPAGLRSAAEMLEWLRLPHRLKALTIGVLAALGIFGVYLPLSGSIDELDASIQDSRKRCELIRTVAELRASSAKLLARLPQSADENWWASYFLQGTQDNDVRLESLAPAAVKGLDLGALKGFEFTLQLSGSFRDIARFIAWMESNDPFVRVTKATLARAGAVVSAHLVVAALVNPEEQRVR